MLEVPKPTRSQVPARRSDYGPKWGPVEVAIKNLRRGRSLQFLKGEHYTVKDLSFKRGLYAAAQKIGETIRVSVLRDRATGAIRGWEVWRTSYGRGRKAGGGADHS